MLKDFKLILFALVGTLIVISCDDEIELRPPIDAGLDYYPLLRDQVREYQVDSIIFDDAPGGNAKDTVKRFIRERIIDVYPDPDSSVDSVFVIERAQRSVESDPWQITDLWTAARSTTEAVRVEENQRYMKFRFPISAGQEWNSLTYIDNEQEVSVGTELIEIFKNWHSTILSIDQSDTIGNFDFTNSVLHVIHADDDNEIERRFVEEKYARDIGLVYRRDSILDSRCKRLGTLEPCIMIDHSVTPPDTSSLPWEIKAEKGYILIQQLIRFE